MDEEGAIGLEHQEPNGLWKPRGEAPRIEDLAAADEQAHKPWTVCRFRTCPRDSPSDMPGPRPPSSRAATDPVLDPNQEHRVAKAAAMSATVPAHANQAIAFHAFDGGWRQVTPDGTPTRSSARACSHRCRRDKHGPVRLEDEQPNGLGADGGQPTGV